MSFWGPFCFGFVMGWVTYRTLRRKTESVALGDIASVAGAIGGAAIVALFKNDAFNAYCLGLALGFIAYFIIGLIMSRQKGAAPGAESDPNSWMGRDEH